MLARAGAVEVPGTSCVPMSALCPRDESAAVMIGSDDDMSLFVALLPGFHSCLSSAPLVMRSLRSAV